MGADFASIFSSSASITVSLTTGTAFGEGTDTLTGIENLNGSRSTDNLTGDAVPNVLHGLVGDDTLSGNDGDDTLIGDEGTDTLDRGNGTDTSQGESEVNCVGHPPRASRTKIQGRWRPLAGCINSVRGEP